MIVPANTLSLGTRVQVQCFNNSTCDWDDTKGFRSVEKACIIGSRNDGNEICLGFAADLFGGMGLVAIRIVREPHLLVSNAKELADYLWWVIGRRTVKRMDYNPGQVCELCAIPLPHTIKMNAPICFPCRTLLDLQ